MCATTDQLGNNRGDTCSIVPRCRFWPTSIPWAEITTGIGLFIQGGMGAEYQNLVTPVSAMANSGMLPPGFFDGDSVPDTDDTRSNVMFVKLTPTVAWRVNPRWTLGLALNVGYGRAEMKLFPETSVMADLDMSGTEGRQLRVTSSSVWISTMTSAGFGFGVRLGFQYRRGSLMLGGAYFSRDLAGSRRRHHDLEPLGPRVGKGELRRRAVRFCLAAAPGSGRGLSHQAFLPDRRGRGLDRLVECHRDDHDRDEQPRRSDGPAVKSDSVSNGLGRSVGLGARCGTDAGAGLGAALWISTTATRRSRTTR